MSSSSNYPCCCRICQPSTAPKTFSPSLWFHLPSSLSLVDLREIYANMVRHAKETSPPAPTHHPIAAALTPKYLALDDFEACYPYLVEYSKDAFLFPNDAHHQGVCWNLYRQARKPVIRVTYERGPSTVRLTVVSGRFCRAHSRAILERVRKVALDLASARKDLAALKKRDVIPVITINDSDSD